jgi:hypothetical protein
MNRDDLVEVGRIAGSTDSSAPTMVKRYAHHTPDPLPRAAATLERGESWQNYGNSSSDALIDPEMQKEASASFAYSY